jgi:ubiquinol-cytochrome c reductase cytochrome c subunit
MTTSKKTSERRFRARTKLRRRVAGLLALGVALIGAGAAYAVFVPRAQTAQAQEDPAQLRLGQQVYNNTCISCHGANLQGVKDRGPSLIGVGDAAVYFQTSARGGELVRLNCASCHNFTGRGGALSAGKFAPDLDAASEDQIYTAMQTGPQNMPKFSDRQLTPDEKKDIIAYVKSVSDGNNNPGGDSLGGFWPASEGVIAWVVGIGALVGVTLWIGSRA